MEPLLAAPDLVHPLGLWGWIGYGLAFLLLIGLSMTAGFVGIERQWPVSAWIAGIVIVSLLLILVEFRLFQAAAADDPELNATLWLLLIGVPVAAVAVLNHFSGRLSWWVLISVALTAAGFTLDACMLDVLSQGTSATPVAWCSAVLAVLLVSNSVLQRCMR